jgi:hypothetical protein
MDRLPIVNAGRYPPVYEFPNRDHFSDSSCSRTEQRGRHDLDLRDFYSSFAMGRSHAVRLYHVPRSQFLPPSPTTYATGA